MLTSTTLLANGPAFGVSPKKPLAPGHLPRHVDEIAFLAGLHAGMEQNGDIAVATAELTYNKLLPNPTNHVVNWEVREVPLEHDTQCRAYGKDAIFKEILAGQTDRAQLELAEWQRLLASENPKAIEVIAIRAVDLTIAYERKGNVGGEIDAVELDRIAGIRWISRKANCPEN